MLTKIGKPSVAGDAVDLLLECHERIRAFLALARRVAESNPGEPGLAEGASRVRRYFLEALPLHARDEEESIAPRLRGRDPAVDRELDTVLREHGEHESAVGALVSACEAIASAPERLPAVSPQLASALEELERQLAPHLRREEAVVFPAMRRLLDREEDAAVAREMRERRAARDPAPAVR